MSLPTCVLLTAQLYPHQSDKYGVWTASFFYTPKGQLFRCTTDTSGWYVSSFFVVNPPKKEIIDLIPS